MIAHDGHTQNFAVSGSSQANIIEFALGGLFNDSSILAQSVQLLRGSVVRVTFIFPPYLRTVEDLGHISANQINEAIIEGMNCAIAQLIAEDVLDLPVSLNWYRKHWADWIVSRQFIEYRKMLRPYQPAALEFEVSAIERRKFRREFYCLTMAVDGFVRGEIDWLIESRHLH